MTRRLLWALVGAGVAWAASYRPKSGPEARAAREAKRPGCDLVVANGVARLIEEQRERAARKGR